MNFTDPAVPLHNCTKQLPRTQDSMNFTDPAVPLHNCYVYTPDRTNNFPFIDVDRGIDGTKNDLQTWKVA